MSPRQLWAYIRSGRGSVAIVAALAAPVLIGIAALVAEFGQGLLVKIQCQRVADAAAYAGALAYAAKGDEASMTSSAGAVAALNGVPYAKVSTILTASPTGDGAKAVKVVISDSVPLLLATVLDNRATLPLTATAYVEVKTSPGPCLLALRAGGAGVSLSGGANATALKCVVASNATVSVPCGTFLTTPTVNYNSSSAPSQPCGGIRPPSGTPSVTIAKKATSDPLVGAAPVTAAISGLSMVSSETAPAAPVVSGGGAIDFAFNATATKAQAVADSCSATFTNNVWTLTCQGASSYKFGDITLGGGITVNFNLAGPASTIYNFSGSINNSGAALNFGPGTYNIVKGLYGANGATTFGAGTFSIGAGLSKCNKAGFYSICNTGASMTFAGPSTFLLRAGAYNGGGSSLTMGGGATNSFRIGAASDGNALFMAGGAITVLGDATGVASLFQLTGDLNVAGGGSCTTIGAAASHDVKGSMLTAGGVILGAGAYFVTNSVALGGNGGGDVTCSGVAVGVNGNAVTFATGGAVTPGNGTCKSLAFCVAAGYNNVTLTAPTSGTYANLLVVGPVVGPGVSPGAAFAEGASNASLSGAFYFPYGPVSLSGGASVGDRAGQCLTLIGSEISLTGGATVASSCIQSSAGGSGGSVLLVE